MSQEGNTTSESRDSLIVGGIGGTLLAGSAVSFFVLKKMDINTSAKGVILTLGATLLASLIYIAYSLYQDAKDSSKDNTPSDEKSTLNNFLLGLFAAAAITTAVSLTTFAITPACKGWV